MTDIHGVADHQTVPRYETLSYLPPLSRDEVRQQIAYVLAQGWNAAIEHEHPDNAMAHYWPMWKLPFFGEQNPDAIMAEIEACHRQYPSHHVRLLAYDNYAQSQGTALLVYRAA